jgi:putative mRNA 3-end processing factor
MEPDVYVRQDGCVRLGVDICCDGFEPEAMFRVQTHAHVDHMHDFDRSKGTQTILMTQGTFDLLVAERNGDLPYRNNIKVLPADGVYRQFGSSQVALTPAGHLPGAVLTSVQLEDGARVCYTSDFSWPLCLLPEGIDTLVLDSTYGNPANVRNYSQDEVETKILDLLLNVLRGQPIAVTGHRGRLQSAIQLLSSHRTPPLIVSSSVAKSIDAFMKHRGFHTQYYTMRSPEALDMLRRETPAIFFLECRDKRDHDMVPHAIKVALTAYGILAGDPIQHHQSMGIYRVAYTDHADFSGTIDLVRAIKPRKVITSNTGGGDRTALAQFIEAELGIPASSEVKEKTRSWGG